jgi:IclR family KDG regulon transcriptional repressor
LPESSYSIQSLVAAFTVVDCFLHSLGKPLRFSDICSATGFSKNRTYRILATLCDWGYLEKDPKTKEYRLGSTFLIMGELYCQNRQSLREAALPFLEELATKSGDFAVLMVPYREDCMVVVEASQGEYSLQGRAGIGEVYTLQGGAASRFFLGALPREERAELLANMEFQKLTEKTVTTRQELEREIEIALSQGYFVAEEDLEPGVVSISAPVRNETREIIAALSLVIPTVRYTEDHKNEAIQLVIRAAEQLSRKIGYFERQPDGREFR